MKDSPRATVECEGSPTVPGRGAFSKGFADEACHDDGVLGSLRRGRQRGGLGRPPSPWPWRSRSRSWLRPPSRASLSSSPPAIHRSLLRIRSASGLRCLSGICRRPATGGLRTTSRSGSCRRPGPRRDAGPGLSGSAVPAEQLLGIRPRVWIQHFELTRSCGRLSPRSGDRSAGLSDMQRRPRSGNRTLARSGEW